MQVGGSQSGQGQGLEPHLPMGKRRPGPNSVGIGPEHFSQVGVMAEGKGSPKVNHVVKQLVKQLVNRY